MSEWVVDHIDKCVILYLESKIMTVWNWALKVSDVVYYYETYETENIFSLVHNFF